MTGTGGTEAGGKPQNVSKNKDPNIRPCKI